jgi:hypothetical protein
MRNRKPVTSERTERWRREDAAPRLTTEAPSLQSLRLILRDFRVDSGLPGKERVQHVIVARAGARFEIPCSEPKCVEGGYDVTTEILQALKSRCETFEGVVSCRGTVREQPCRCSLSFVGHATYASA